MARLSKNTCFGLGPLLPAVVLLTYFPHHAFARRHQSQYCIPGGCSESDVGKHVYGCCCRNDCSDSEHSFWGDCCLVDCANDGLDHTSLPFWACWDENNSYLLYFIFGLIPLFIFLSNLIFWFKGYAVIPTRIESLANNAQLGGYWHHQELGQRAVINKPTHVDFVSCQATADYTNDEGFVLYKYSAVIEYWVATEESPIPRKERKTVPLNQVTHRQLEEFCSARGGKCLGPTLDPKHHTRGFLLMVNPDTVSLSLYREWFYHGLFKSEVIGYGSCAVVLTINMLRLGSVRDVLVVITTTTIVFALALYRFIRWGCHGKGGMHRPEDDDRAYFLSS
jgi:hypothetical protein